MELVYEWSPDGNFQKVDTPLWTNSTYEKDLMDNIFLMGESMCKS